MAAEREPVGRGTGKSVWGPARRSAGPGGSSLRVTPGRTRTASTPVYRPNWGVGPTRLPAVPSGTRRFPSNGTPVRTGTAGGVGRLSRTGRPPTTGVRARYSSIGSGRRGAADRAALRPPSPTPFGREHTTPIVQTRGGRRAPRAASEPGSFGGPRRPDGGGRGTAGMARLPDVSLRASGPRTRRHRPDSGAETTRRDAWDRPLPTAKV